MPDADFPLFHHKFLACRTWNKVWLMWTDCGEKTGRKNWYGGASIIGLSPGELVEGEDGKGVGLGFGFGLVPEPHHSNAGRLAPIGELFLRYHGSVRQALNLCAVSPRF